MAVSAAAAAAAGMERVAAAAVMAVGGRGTGEERAGWGPETEAARGEGAKTVGRAESAVSGECGAGNPRCVCARVWEECVLYLTPTVMVVRSLSGRSGVSMIDDLEDALFEEARRPARPPARRGRLDRRATPRAPMHRLRLCWAGTASQGSAGRAVCGGPPLARGASPKAPKPPTKQVWTTERRARQRLGIR